MISTLEDSIKSVIRDIPDFPKPGILFKDITPLLQHTRLSKEIIATLGDYIHSLRPDAIVCLESRGFWYGMSLAQAAQVPMIPIRKKGKLPYKTLSQSYELEYGNALIEIHEDAIQPGMNVLIHDDVLATGGTAEAAAKLLQQAGARVAGYAFLLELSFLSGRDKVKKYSENIHSLCTY